MSRPTALGSVALSLLAASLVGVPCVATATTVALEADELRDFSGGFALVRLGQTWRLIDVDGEVTAPSLPDGWEPVGDVRSGRLLMRRRDAWRYVDPEGRWAAGGPYEAASLFHDGVAVVVTEVALADGARKARRTVAIDLDGRVRRVLDPGTAKPGTRWFPKLAAALRDRCAWRGRVRFGETRGGKTRFGFVALRASGGDAEPAARFQDLAATFDGAGCMSDGLAAVATREDDGSLRWGFVRASGEVAVAPDYTAEPGPFRGGRARVTAKDGRHGYIDEAGALVELPEWHVAHDFSGGRALVAGDGGSAVLGVGGERVVTLGGPVEAVGQPRFADGVVMLAGDGLIAGHEGRAFGGLKPDGRWRWRAHSRRLRVHGGYVSGRARVTFKPRDGQAWRQGYIAPSGEVAIEVTGPASVGPAGSHDP